MPDWSAHLRTRLAPLRLSPAREAEIVDELSQHLDDRYEAAARRRRRRRRGRGDWRSRSCTNTTRWRARCARCGRRGRRRRSPRARRGAGSSATSAGPALRRAHAAEAARLHAGRRPHARARHRRQHRDLQPGQRDAVPAAAGRGPGAARLRVPRRRQRRLLVPAVRDAARPRDGPSTAWRPGAASRRASTPATPPSSCRASSSPATSSRCSACSRRSDACCGPSDDVTPGAHPVAVIAYDFWQTRFGGRPDVVGREIRLNGHVFTIVGVAPAGFPGPQLGNTRQTLRADDDAGDRCGRRARATPASRTPTCCSTPTNSWLFGVGRLKPGVTLERAGAELDPVLAEFFRTRVKLAARGHAAARHAPVPIDDPNPARGRSCARRRCCWAAWSAPCC